MSAPHHAQRIRAAMREAGCTVAHLPHLCLLTGLGRPAVLSGLRHMVRRGAVVALPPQPGQHLPGWAPRHLHARTPRREARP